jgi:hypothetical protein
MRIQSLVKKQATDIADLRDATNYLLGSIDQPASAVARLVKERDQMSEQIKALQSQLNFSI